MAVQRAAAEALGDRKGAVVALDPRTGAVLAMVSYPRYDPNEIDDSWEELNSNEGKPLLNRATQGLYPPGSVFKMIVAAAALETGAVTPETEFDDTGSVTAGGFVVHNYGDKVYGAHDFTEAFASSINTTFAKIGVELGADTLAGYAGDFGFGQDLPWPLAAPPASSPTRGSMDKAHVAQASYGQGEVLATPLQMALAAAAVANGGQIMKPYMVGQVIGYPVDQPQETKPEVWLTPISAETAATLTGPHDRGGQRGHGNRGRAEQRPGSRQDRDRRSGRRRITRLVRGLRAGRRPASGGGGAGRERRHRGQRSRPDRARGHRRGSRALTPRR